MLPQWYFHEHYQIFPSVCTKISFTSVDKWVLFFIAWLHILNKVIERKPQSWWVKFKQNILALGGFSVLDCRQLIKWELFILKSLYIGAVGGCGMWRCIESPGPIRDKHLVKESLFRYVTKGNCTSKKMNNCTASANTCIYSWENTALFRSYFSYHQMPQAFSSLRLSHCCYEIKKLNCSSC